MKNTLIVLFVLLYASFSPCEAQVRQEEAPLQITPAVTRSLIDSLGQALSRHYIFPDTAIKMVGYLKDEFKKGAYAGIKDPRELADRLLQDLQKAHHDGHLRLHYAPGLSKDLSDTTGMAERRRIGDSLALIDFQQQNYFFTKAEVLPGNIGYVKFNGFVGLRNEARPTFTSAFRFVAHTKALIIDLRDNGGGSPVMVSQVESYFFPSKIHMNDIIDRNNGKRIFWTDPAEADSVILEMPVYILTSRLTFSGAEDFSYGMQSVKRAVVVGDTTGGGAHPVGPVPVALGFVADIPFARSLNPYTHTDWEGTGVIPDIPVNASKALEKAEETIFTQDVTNAANEQEKRRAQWQLNNLIAMHSEGTKDSSALASYTGKYQGGLVFYVSGSSLYCRNAERDNQVFKLLPISGNRWVLDENVQVEFTKDVPGLNMWWSNGRLSFKQKEK